MKETFLTITENIGIAKDINKMVLSGDCSEIIRPGQFINLKLEGFFLRRPISVCDSDEKSVTVIYKTVGGGTEKMAEMKPGEGFDALVGLGNGFDSAKSGDKPLLIGGGYGLPPLYKLCRVLLSEGKSPIVIGGFNTKSDIFYYNEFKALGADIRISTADGSFGTNGFVTDVMKSIDIYSYFYACGPMIMMKNIASLAPTSGEVSLESRMGCGFGACMGCSCETVKGPKRICKDGPVFEKEEVLWQN